MKLRKKEMFPIFLFLVSIFLLIENTIIKVLLAPLIVINILVFLRILTLEDKEENITKIYISKIQLLLLATILLLVSALVITLFDMAHYIFVFFNTVLVLILPGYLFSKKLLRVNLSCLEVLVISYVLSLFIAGVFFTIITFLFLEDIYAKTLLTYIFYYTLLTLILFDAVGNLLRKRENIFGVFKRIEVSINIYQLNLGLILFIILITHTMLYPQMTYLVGLDIVRHFAAQRILINMPTKYRSHYPFFHAHIAIVSLMSLNPFIDVLFSILVVWTIIAVIAFYNMSLTLLRDKKLATIATNVWTLFSGFGWLYVINKKLFSDVTHEEAILSAFSFTNMDIGYGLSSWLWLWYRPLTVGHTALFLFIYTALDQRRGIKDKTRYLILTIVTTVIVLTHPSEYAILIIVLLAIHLSGLRNVLRTCSSAILLGTFLSIPFVYLYSSVSFIFIFGGVSISVIISILNTIIHGVRHEASKNGRDDKTSVILFKKISFGKIVVTFLCILYFDLLVYWMFMYEKLLFEPRFLTVPWWHYPVLLGVTGLLAFSTLYSLKVEKTFDHVKFMIVVMILSVILGRVLSLINTNVALRIIYTGWIGLFIYYYERRILIVIHSINSLLASITLIKIGRIMKRNRSVVYVLITILFITGMLSTLYSQEYFMYLYDRRALNEEEISIAEQLSLLSSDTNILTFSQRSLELAEYAPARWVVKYARFGIWASSRPELPLLLTSSYNNNLAIFLQNYEYEMLQQLYNESYVLNHLLNLTPTTFELKNAKIYLFKKFIPPTKYGKSALITEEEENEENLNVYTFLSAAGINYTIVVLDDIRNIIESNILIIPTEKMLDKVLNVLISTNNTDKEIYVFNTDGYGFISNSTFMASSLFKISSDHRAYIKIAGANKRYEEFSWIAVPTTIDVCTTNDSLESLTIADDNLSLFWEIGNDNIILLDDNATKISGQNSLKIVGKEINSTEWQIFKILDTSLNFSKYDFISFYFYGYNSSNRYTLQFGKDAQNFFSYTFTESWYGWHKVYLPLHAPDGNYVIMNVNFTKKTVGTPNLSNITRIDFISGGNATSELLGIWYIDKLSLEQAPVINLIYELKNAEFIDSIRIVNLYDREEEFSIRLNISNNTYFLPNYKFLNGLTASQLFGNTSYGYAHLFFNGDEIILNVSVKMPLDSSLRLQFDPIVKSLPLQIINCKEELSLPVNISVYPLYTHETPYVEVLSSFSGLAPFALKIIHRNVSLFYLNVYPLFKTFKNDEGSNTVYSFIRDIFECSGVEFPKGAVSNSFTYLDIYKVLLRNISVEDGTITINFSDSVIIDLKETRNIITKTSNFILSDDIRFITIINSVKGRIFCKNFRILKRLGFYSVLNVIDATMQIDAPIKIALINGNGSIEIVEVANFNIVADELRVVLRGFNVHIMGSLILQDLYTFRDVYIAYTAIGNDVQISGELELNFEIFDKYLAGTFLYIRGNYTGFKTYYGWNNEIKDLNEAIPYILITSVVFLFYTVISSNKIRLKSIISRHLRKSY